MTRARRVLVARPDHLGDLLLTLPAIEVLKRDLPGIELACMVPRALLAIAERASDVDAFIPAPTSIADPPLTADSPHLAAAAERIRGFDLALLPRPHDPWSGAVVARAGIPVRVGHARPGTAEFVTHRFPERTGHHVAREATVLALRAVALLGAGERRPRAARRERIVVRAEDHAAARAVLADNGMLGARPVVVHPTAGWPLKSWPAARWSSVVNAIAVRLDAPVIVAGQHPDRGLLDEIARGSGVTAAVVDSIAIGPLAALHRSARAVVGVDSGALHLAAAVGTPVVSLFGPFGPGRVRPLAPPERAVSLFRPIPCSPCGTLEDPPCGARANPACLRAIEAQDVVEAVVRVSA